MKVNNGFRMPYLINKITLSKLTDMIYLALSTHGDKAIIRINNYNYLYRNGCISNSVNSFIPFRNFFDLVHHPFQTAMRADHIKLIEVNGKIARNIQ